jgi:hypothetical protein
VDWIHLAQEGDEWWDADQPSASAKFHNVPKKYLPLNKDSAQWG